MRLLCLPLHRQLQDGAYNHQNTVLLLLPEGEDGRQEEVPASVLGEPEPGPRLLRVLPQAYQLPHELMPETTTYNYQDMNMIPYP